MIDDLPSELRYVQNSLRIDNRNLTDPQDADEGTVSGQRIAVILSQVSPNQVVTIYFQATAVGNIPSGSGISNTANLTATNAPNVASNPAIVIVNPFGTVYSGNGGSSVPISNARISVFTDDQLENLAVFPPSGFEPNTDNHNPFTSDQLGRYSFKLAEQNNISAGSYFFNVIAENYRSRMIAVSVFTSGERTFQPANLSIRRNADRGWKWF